METYNCKGTITFAYSKADGVIHHIHDYDTEMEKEMYSKVTIFKLFSGEDFLEMVDDGSIIDYDGSISDIFVNGYESNLGLAHKGICQGKFIVDKDQFLDFCKEFKVEVSWANR